MKAKEKALRYLKDKEMRDIEDGDIPIQKEDCKKAIDIAIQETKKEMIEKIDKIMFRGENEDILYWDLLNELKKELESEGE